MPQLFVTTPVTRTFLCSYLVGWSFNWAIFTPRAAQPVITNALRSTIVSRDAILIIQSLNASHGSVLEIAQSGGPVSQFFCALPPGSQRAFFRDRGPPNPLCDSTTGPTRRSQPRMD
jgi:hypothetical protein